MTARPCCTGTSTSSRRSATGPRALAPYEPVRRDDRLFARGVGDDGYSTFSALLAVEAMEANDIAHSRCVVLIEASEESGSPDLEAYLDYLKDHLGKVELMICLDSGALTYDRLWVTTSLRGVVNVDLEIEVLSQGQHSGSASGVVPSSFRILRELLDRVEDASTGEVLVRRDERQDPRRRRARGLRARRGVRRHHRARTADAGRCGVDGRERRRTDPSAHVVSRHSRSSDSAARRHPRSPATSCDRRRRRSSRSACPPASTPRPPRPP